MSLAPPGVVIVTTTAVLLTALAGAAVAGAGAPLFVALAPLSVRVLTPAPAAEAFSPFPLLLLPPKEKKARGVRRNADAVADHALLPRLREGGGWGAPEPCPSLRGVALSPLPPLLARAVRLLLRVACALAPLPSSSMSPA